VNDATQFKQQIINEVEKNAINRYAINYSTKPGKNDQIIEISVFKVREEIPSKTVIIT